ncbi:Zinc finger transcription factor ace1 [Tolypocladium capitatum]|uniref:Zinc finger transcription factor ace1 n=1 Tax=Tolypocladium capitatum TaxID=45235 RepID=A0A2K3Q4Z4_9HYPO|nr:Zinc finger transcription factor ace1 [Tolypocladium capitatum]
MDEGAIIGTVVGVVVAVALLVLCLYPVVVYGIRRRRHADSLPFDPEAAIAAYQAGRPGADPGSHRRLPSSDSFKRDRELSRGHVGATRGKESAGTSHDGSATHAEDDHGPPLPFYVGEYMPESEVHDDNPGVLKGTSADYYSPSIPSEAFGMITTPPDLHVDIPLAGRSRSSSLRYNVIHMFRRKSSRDNALDPYTTAAVAGNDQSAEAGVVELHGATALRQIVTNEDPAESPTEVSPTTMMPAAPAPSSVMTPPPSQLAEPSFKHSPLSPACPAPGTVNPMDIMPATTESEVWHRTEHQLFVSSYDSPERISPPPEHCRSAALTQPPTPTEMTWHVERERVEDRSDMHLTPLTIPESGRHPSYPSDQSTPFPGPGSTDPSSHNTPSTQIDSPSSESMHGSDFRHSVSPQPLAPSPNAGVFRCNEPGCNQVFERSNKLRHHQRYHNKDHKCPHANCGKGFGTKTHLQRHINDRHEKKKLFHCSVQDCDYSRAGGKGFPRKDNWRRHMTKIHNVDQTRLPEPIEVDHDMNGT